MKAVLVISVKSVILQKIFPDKTRFYFEAIVTPHGVIFRIERW